MPRKRNNPTGSSCARAGNEKVVAVSTLPLFEEEEPALKLKLKAKLAQLARNRLFIGTSSWKYPGWMGQIYTSERYESRGRFSKKRFEAACLAEYAEVFPVVCGDFSFYQFPPPRFWEKFFTGLPAGFTFAFKVPEDITVAVFPIHPRYGARAGRSNPGFLNNQLLESEFLNLVAPFKDHVSVLIFEFGTLLTDPEPFLNALAPFLAALPATFRYAVEVRNPEFLVPAYFELLRRYNIAHVFNSWTRMPDISHQMRLPDAFTADFTIARALLRMGRKYETAVRQFTPYERVQEPNHEVRDALRNLLVRAKQRDQATYLFVNNRLEGNAPGTIEAIVDSL